VINQSTTHARSRRVALFIFCGAAAANDRRAGRVRTIVGLQFESRVVCHRTILHDIVAEAFENAASSRRQPHETLSLHRLDRKHC
jgi:hypothetical protein